MSTPDESPEVTASISQDAFINCDHFVGYVAVYRVCMGVACFFLALMILMLCVFSSKDPRAYIQNG